MTTVGALLDNSAVLLNDSAKTVFTYTAQLPYFNMAQGELAELMELNNVPATNKRSTSITVAPSVTIIDFTTTPALPSDLVEIQQISERQNGTTVDYIPMTRREFLPPFVNQLSSLLWWAWLDQQIQFIGATLEVQLMLDYIATKLPAATTTTSPITLINASSFLQYRTAGLCAEFIGENPERAASLNNFATMAADRFLGIDTKGRQAISTRRRPFMSGYKARSGPW